MGVTRSTNYTKTKTGFARRYSKSFQGTLEEAVHALRPAQPLYVISPDVITRTAKDFVKAFPGKPLYAVKTNPDMNVLRALVKGGVRSFDVASLEEIQLVKSVFPAAELHFMHTVKAPEAIRSAYSDYGVRHFVLDHEAELFKIMRETDLAQDLNLVVRISLPKNDKALIDFSSKFGASYQDAIELLRKCRPVAQNLGLSFHVGTQTIDANRYAQAISYAAQLLREADVKIDVLNVGGGFPVAYAGDEPVCSLQDCMDAITSALEAEELSHIPLLAEPGRVLVARGAALVTRVELRKNDVLYLNDGVYGGLFDACDWIGLRYPVQGISCDRPFMGEVEAFRFAGPTCDSLDMMNGPFVLPADIEMGDWVVVQNVGAYSQSLRSNFNGFGHADTVCIYESRPSKSS